MESQTHLVDGLYEDYLRLRQERADGRRRPSSEVSVSACCHRACTTDRATGWDLCVLCGKRTQLVVLAVTAVPARSYDRWKRLRVRATRSLRPDRQERWVVGFLDRWRPLRPLFERRPGGRTRREWELMLWCWELLLSSKFGSRERVAEVVGLTPKQVRVRVEQAREIVFDRYRRAQREA